MTSAADAPPPVWAPQREVSADGREQWWVEPADGTTDRLATERGLVAVRRVLRMERSLVDGPPLGASTPTRDFRPGLDDEAWVALNAAAFADHPDQGRWTLADLHARMAEPWFDPEGLRLAEDRAGALIGSCWTKVHDDPDGALGEIHVIGVHPAHHGEGLGRGLTTAGLRWLHEHRGIDVGMLYVESSNEPALGLYRSMGFVVVATRTGYEPSGAGGAVGR